MRRADGARGSAPAKLTVSLRVTGVRADGYHLLDAEMVTLDLADTLEITPVRPAAPALEVVADWPGRCRRRGGTCGRTDPADNLVTRALAAVGRSARVRLVKRIPPGAGLGGGSADAAAVLRWAGCADPAVAAGLGADVPFCVAGGRARVTGIGEVVEPLPVRGPVVRAAAAALRGGHRRRLPGLTTGWPPGPAPDGRRRRGQRPGGGGPGRGAPAGRLARTRWSDATGPSTPRLAGSGSTWFVEGDAGRTRPRTAAAWLEVGRAARAAGATRTTPAGGEVLQ